MENNPLIELLKDAKNQSIVAPILEGCQKLDEVLAEAQRLERPTKYMDELREEGIKKINLHLFDITQARTDEIRDHFGRLETEWTDEVEKGITRRTMNLEIEKTRFAAMGKDELNAELESIASGNYAGADPLTVDAIFSACRSAGVKGIEPYRKLAIEADYRSPWLHNEACASMKTELKAYDNISPGLIPLIAPEGSLAVVAFGDVMEGENNE